MFLFFGIISALFFLCKRYKLYIVLFLPIFLLINYVATCIICYSEFFQDSSYLNTVFNIASFGEFQRSNFDFKLINRIFLSISFFYLQFFIVAIIFRKIKGVKKISQNIINFINYQSKNIFENKDVLKKANILNNLKIFFSSLIIIHAFSFYTSEYAFFYSSYLLAKKAEYYYFYPILSTYIAKVFPALIYLILGLDIIKNKLNIFKTKFSILLYVHAFIWFSSTNSRWTFVWLISMGLILVAYTVKSNISKFLKIIYCSSISSINIYLSLFFFQKVIFLRNQTSGLSTIFSLGGKEFDILETIKTFVLLNFSSPIFIYSGIEQNLRTSFFYDIISLSPLPSFMHGIDTAYLNSVIPRVSLYGPSSSYLQIYQNNFFYSSILVILFGFLLSIILSIKKSISKNNLSSAQIKTFPFLSEVFITAPLLYGYQYQVRTIMRYYWAGFIVIILIPFLFKIISKNK